ncbi:MAG: DJ-1/PfpI family protein [Myxococcales bacterium]|nr:DJ-1/PfpI family protein [Myxococcales bacterium]
MPKPSPPTVARQIVILALPGAFSLDVLGPLEIFHTAQELLDMRVPGTTRDSDRSQEHGEVTYNVRLVGALPGPIETLSGVSLVASDVLENIQDDVDTLLVAGGDIRRMTKALEGHPKLKSELRRVASGTRRLASVCTGSFVLAAAGLLNGKRVTTHWAACDLLEERFPQLHVMREPIYTRDGNVYTSAGATTGMDLTLALVREDLGGKLACEIARWLVLYVSRPGSQQQLSLSLRAQATEREPLRDLLHHILENPQADLSVTALATRVGMSVRNFARMFRRELSMTPAAYVEASRVEAARRKLEFGQDSIDEIAMEVGFRNADTLRRAFVRQTGAAPSILRKRP